MSTEKIKQAGGWRMGRVLNRIENGLKE
jgi:hypothetical protein